MIGADRVRRFRLRREGQKVVLTFTLEVMVLGIGRIKMLELSVLGPINAGVSLIASLCKLFRQTKVSVDVFVDPESSQPLEVVVTNHGKQAVVVA